MIYMQAEKFAFSNFDFFQIKALTDSSYLMVSLYSWIAECMPWKRWPFIEVKCKFTSTLLTTFYFYELEALLFPKITIYTTSITNTPKSIYFHLFLRLPSKIILGITCSRDRIQIMWLNSVNPKPKMQLVKSRYSKVMTLANVLQITCRCIISYSILGISINSNFHLCVHIYFYIYTNAYIYTHAYIYNN